MATLGERPEQAGIAASLGSVADSYGNTPQSSSITPAPWATRTRGERSLTSAPG
ncbi:hypothetical protein F4561_000066 [Lipingzhangella halophila]|uniref:Uncharacterized protein n=1 Tax=Lipingzhangella halophila TaxID=1783352 RepID=A0A7W7RD86_9ACTN|nr:hypothetical protein [Lipingzhangella halophila]